MKRSSLLLHWLGQKCCFSRLNKRCLIRCQSVSGPDVLDRGSRSVLTTFVINGKETFECHGDPKRALSLQAESCSDKQVVKMDVSVENICFVRLQQEILDCPYLLLHRCELFGCYFNYFFCCTFSSHSDGFSRFRRVSFETFNHN